MRTRKIVNQLPEILARLWPVGPANLLHFFEPDRERCTDVEGLGAHVQTLKDSWYELEERALDDWEEEDESKAKAMARIQHLRRAWIKMRRMYGISGIIDESGEVCIDPDASAEALRAHWSKVFAHRKLISPCGLKFLCTASPSTLAVSPGN